jgi:hypothetical protein
VTALAVFCRAKSDLFKKMMADVLELLVKSMTLYSFRADEQSSVRPLFK